MSDEHRQLAFEVRGAQLIWHGIWFTRTGKMALSGEPVHVGHVKDAERPAGWVLGEVHGGEFVRLEPPVPAAGPGEPMTLEARVVERIHARAVPGGAGAAKSEGSAAFAGLDASAVYEARRAAVAQPDDDEGEKSPAPVLDADAVYASRRPSGAPT